MYLLAAFFTMLLLAVVLAAARNHQSARANQEPVRLWPRAASTKDAGKSTPS